MIRLSLLYLFVAVLMIRSVRDWYLSLCGLIVLSVFIQHPSMPTMMFGINGLNPWNALLAVVVANWLLSRKREGPKVPVPTSLSSLFVAYVAMVIVFGVIALADSTSFKGSADSFTAMVLIGGIINPLKYTLVGYMFFDGAHNRKRVRLALMTSIGSAMLYAVMMFKTLKLQVFHIDYRQARHATDKLIGLYANDMAEILAYALWGALLLLPVLGKKWKIGLCLLGIAVSVPTFICLKSRAGFLAFLLIGSVVGTVRWRRILVLLVLCVVVTVATVPTVKERVMTGIDLRHEKHDWDSISAGRLTDLWPPVIDQIQESPLFGFGRYAMLREDCYFDILAMGGSVPGHPHNAYLEILLDAGVLGLGICLGLFGWIGYAGYRLMRIRGDPLIASAGAICVCALMAELGAAVAGSSFFPSQSTVVQLCVWGVALKVYLVRVARPWPARRPVPRPIGPRGRPALNRGMR